MLGFLSVRGHTIYSKFLSSDSVVFDLGAHKGEFSLKIIGQFNSKCIALEANSSLFKEIPEIKKMAKHNCAISDSCGEEQFNLHKNNEGSSLEPIKEEDRIGHLSVKTVTMPALCAEYDISVIDLVKFDIEGAEVRVINSLSDAFIQNTKQFSVEFHDFCDRIQKSEVDQIICRMKMLNFEVIKFSIRNTDYLFLNRRFYHVSAAVIIFLKVIRVPRRVWIRLSDYFRKLPANSTITFSV